MSSTYCTPLMGTSLNIWVMMQHNSFSVLIHWNGHFEKTDPRKWIRFLNYAKRVILIFTLKKTALFYWLHVANADGISVCYLESLGGSDQWTWGVCCWEFCKSCLLINPVTFCSSDTLLTVPVSYLFQSAVTVREGVDIIQTNMSFLRQQFTRMATHILRCRGDTTQIQAQHSPRALALIF